jgi:lipoprotein-anchoring transpeptidase ErfK/SrfK
VSAIEVPSWIFVISLFALASINAQTRVEIDLQEQSAYLIRNGRVAMVTPIASGRYGHLTPSGSFKVIEKERNHFSSIYGKIVDGRGNTIVSDADADMPVPRGGKFIPAPMRYFVRFSGANGMHAGYLPGYPASHGCVRLPEQNAIAFFNSVDVGTPVTVFGRTPRGQYSQPRAWHGRNYADPRFDPYFERRFPPPGWWR